MNINTKCAKYIIVGINLLVLSACSSKPSAGNVEDNLSQLFDGCSLVELKDVKKLDGMPKDDGTYMVKTSFDVKINPTDINRDLYKDYVYKKSKSEEIDVIDKKISDEYAVESERVNKEFDEKSRNYPDMYSSLMDMKAVEMEKVNEKLKPLEDARSELIKNNPFLRSSWDYEIKNKQMSEFDKNCKINSSFAREILLTIVGKYYSPKIFGEGGVAASFTYTMPMVKTENGWRMNF